MLSQTKIVDEYIRNLDDPTDSQMQTLRQTAEELASSPIVLAHCERLFHECTDPLELVWFMAEAIQASKGQPAKLVVFPGGKITGIGAA